MKTLFYVFVALGAIVAGTGFLLQEHMTWETVWVMLLTGGAVLCLSFLVGLIAGEIENDKKTRSPTKGEPLW